MILGIHVSKSNDIMNFKTVKDISEAIERDTKKLGLNAAQIFTFGPQIIAPNKVNYEAVIESSKDIDLTVHSAYPTVGVWKVNRDNKNEAKSKRYIDNLISQLVSCKKINAWGLVVHIAKIFPDIAAETMKLLKPMVKKTGVKLLIEMVASKADPNQTYETPEKIDNLTTLIGYNEDWWGWCVDTAHLWGAGVDIQSYQSMKKWLADLTHKKKILLFHLNGSSANRGSGKDKHEIAFSPDDSIWGKIDPAKSGAYAIVEFALKYDIPIICEINRGNAKECIRSLNKLKELSGV